jgi:uncharacterized protein (TIGR03382 family)
VPGDSADGGAEDPDSEREPAPEPECTSEPTGEFYCKLLVTECESDDDCLADFTCQENPERPVCGGSSSGTDAGAGDPSGSTPDDSGGSDSGDGERDVPERDPEADARRAAPEEGDGCGDSDVPAEICLPPHYYEVGVDLGGSSGLGEGGPTAGGGQDPRSEEDDGAEPPDGDHDGASKSDTGSDANSGSNESADEDEDGDGCRAAGQGNTGSLGWLALSGLALVRRRRAHG